MSKNKKILFGLAIAMVLTGAIAFANYKEPISEALKVLKVGPEEGKVSTGESLAPEEPIVPTEPVIISGTGTWSGSPGICGMAGMSDAIVIGKVKKVTMGSNKTARKNLRKAVDEAFWRIDDFETLYTEAIIQVETYLKNHSTIKMWEGSRLITPPPEYFTEKEIAVRVMGGKVGNVTFITEFYEPYNYGLPFEQNKKPFEVNQRLILFLQKNPKGYFTLERDFCKDVIINDPVTGLPSTYGMPLSEVLKIVERCKDFSKMPEEPINETKRKEMEREMREFIEEEEKKHPSKPTPPRELPDPKLYNKTEWLNPEEGPYDMDWVMEYNETEWLKLWLKAHNKTS